MRIAIASESNQGLEGLASHHFGRCPYFTIVEVKDDQVKEVQAVGNPFAGQHAPGQVPGFINSQDVDVMISGGMGGRAIEFFRSYNIGVSTGANGTVRQTLEKYLAGELNEAAPCAESVAHGH